MVFTLKNESKKAVNASSRIERFLKRKAHLPFGEGLEGLRLFSTSANEKRSAQQPLYLLLVEGGWRAKEETRRRLRLSFFQRAAACGCLEISFAEFSNLFVNLTKGMPAIKETNGVGMGRGE